MKELLLDESFQVLVGISILIIMFGFFLITATVTAITNHTERIELLSKQGQTEELCMLLGKDNCK